MLIRNATPDDWPAIWPFLRRIVAAGETFTWPRDVSEEQARAMWMLESPGRTVVAVAPDRTILGTAKMNPNHMGPAAHIAGASFMVDPEHTGRGVGRALGEHVLNWARAEGYRAMRFNAVAVQRRRSSTPSQFNAVVETNTRAVALWRSLGFAVLGTLVPLLQQLPERERMILGLRFFRNMTQTQIAERVGISSAITESDAAGVSVCRVESTAYRYRGFLGKDTAVSRVNVGGRGYRGGMSSSVETPATAGQWWQVDDAELRAALTDLHTTMRRNYHVMLELIREADSRGLAGSSGYPNLPALLADMLRIPRTQATQCVEQARLVIPAASVTGADTQPPLYHTGQALAAGLIGADHLASIATTTAALPHWADTPIRADVEATLVATAHSTDAKTISKLGRMILERLDQNGPQPRDQDPTQQPNQLRTHTTRTGRMRFTGDIDAEAAALFTGLLGPLAKPRPAEGYGRDPRGAPQRLGDAFVDILRLAAGNDDVPSQGGEKPTVVVTVPLEVLEKELGTAILASGTFLSAAHARMLACDCRIVPMVLGSNSEPLDIGRADRNVPLGMRRALVHRDRGCAHPHCDRPAKWCHAHHIQPWAAGGPTTLSNLVLLCGSHHRLLHFSEWEVAITNGKPEFYPPPFLDPERKPLRNHLHNRLE